MKILGLDSEIDNEGLEFNKEDRELVKVFFEKLHNKEPMKKIKIEWNDGIMNEIECYEFQYKGKKYCRITPECMADYFRNWIMKHPNLKRGVLEGEK